MKIILSIVSVINEKSYGQSDSALIGPAHSYASVSMHMRTIADRQRI
jgi:hypothetical protein